MKKTEQKKLFVVRNTHIRRLWALCAEDCAEPYLTSGGLVRVPHAPPLVCLDLYVGDMI